MNDRRNPALEKKAGDVGERPAKDGDVVPVETVEAVLETLIGHVTEIRSGPVPSAAEMKGYAEVGETFPERILVMAENRLRHEMETELAEQKHCHEMEQLELAQDRESAERFHGFRSKGQTFAFTLILCGFATSALAAYFGAYTAAAVLAGILGAVAGVFITGKFRKPPPPGYVNRDKAS